MLEHMGKWLAQLRALTGTCASLARSIRSLIKMIPELARKSTTKAFVEALLEHVARKPNLPQSTGFLVGLPLIEGSANYVNQSLYKAIQLVQRCGTGTRQCLPMNGLFRLSTLVKFISTEHNIDN